MAESSNLTIKNLTRYDYDDVVIMLSAQGYPSTYVKIEFGYIAQKTHITKEICCVSNEMLYCPFDSREYTKRDLDVFVHCTPLSCHMPALQAEEKHIFKAHRQRPVTVHERPPYRSTTQGWGIAFPDITISLEDKYELSYDSDTEESDYETLSEDTSHQICVGQKITFTYQWGQTLP
jgi:hypothetical protein